MPSFVSLGLYHVGRCLAALAAGSEHLDILHDLLLCSDLCALDAHYLVGTAL